MGVRVGRDSLQKEWLDFCFWGCANGAFQTGLLPIEYDSTEGSPTARSAKRKLGDAGLEIPDSDDDYGWDPDDEAHLPPEPPQWQGSEDLIVGTQRSDAESVSDGKDVDEGEAEGGGDDEDTPQ